MKVSSSENDRFPADQSREKTKTKPTALTIRRLDRIETTSQCGTNA
jgi:hypothetical protein